MNFNPYRNKYLSGTCRWVTLDRIVPALLDLMTVPVCLFDTVDEVQSGVPDARVSPLRSAGTGIRSARVLAVSNVYW
jgi:hypothetical protein